MKPTSIKRAGITLMICAVLALAAKTILSGALELTLADAAQHGNVSLVKQLLRLGVSPASADEGFTALLGAVSNVDPEMVKTLVDAGANVNAREASFGYTPLLDAATTNVSIVHLLLQKEADVNAQDYEGNTLLMIAASNADLDVVQALLAGGAKVNIRNNENQTALTKALTCPRESGPLEREDVVAVLKKSGAKK